MGKPRYVTMYPWQEKASRIIAFTDTDYAGCPVTRKSTSGGIACVDGSAVKTWSSTQASTAQSSGEAEYYSMVEAVLKAKGVEAVAKELGLVDGSSRIVLKVDSSAAKGLASRRGAVKVRHLETKWFWSQEQVRRGKVVLVKVMGTINPADVMTKYQVKQVLKDLLGRVGVILE